MNIKCRELNDAISRAATFRQDFANAEAARVTAENQVSHAITVAEKAEIKYSEAVRELKLVLQNGS